MPIIKDSSSKQALTPAMHHILLALLEGDRHGYALMQSVETISQGDMRLGPATLYGSIKKLIDGKLIEESGDRPDADNDDERRRYYRLTAQGHKAVVLETARLERLVIFAHRFVRAI
jgi:DNA-binding PadR family transcriptional regulator